MKESGQTSFHADLSHALDREAKVQIGLAKDRRKREKADLRSTPLSKIGDRGDQRRRLSVSGG
jgi:hypothetical protein